MKITEKQLKRIISEASDWYDNEAGHETLADRKFADSDRDITNSQLSEARLDIKDAIQMLEAEEDPTGVLFHVINRLHEALGNLQ